MLQKGNTEWFTHDRFGIFIHWGLYALPARGEWIKRHEKISEEQYSRYFKRFNPDLFAPQVWADAAAKAGMKYFVMTTKHHDGFCLWDSKLTDYKSVNTPFGKELLSPILKAFRDKNFKPGLYHSLYDWHHPDYIIDHAHPLREHPDALEMNKKRDMKKYSDYLHGQVKELLTEFGKIDIMWFDMSFKACEYELSQGFNGKGKNEWDSEKLIKMIRKLQPEIILNNRLDIDQDIVTPEQFMPRECIKREGKPVIWESCQTLNGSWGYNPNAEEWKSPEQLIQLLVNAVSSDGNLLMNISPTGRGDIDAKTLECLDVYGEWMAKHSRSIYGCGESQFVPPAGCQYTQNGKTLYLHIFNWPFKHMHLDGFDGRIEYAQMLHDASEVKFTESSKYEPGGYTSMSVKKDSVVFHLPIKKPDVTVPVVEIFLK